MSSDKLYIKMSKILTIIPARLASTRLPNKPLADILGKPMIVRVFEQAKKANLGEVVVACDSAEIANAIENIGGKAIITDPNLPSGTDRIFAAMQQIPNYQDFEIIVNLQGDLPAIDPKVIKAAANTILQSDADIATVASIISDKEEINNPNVVKIAIAFLEDSILGNAILGNALYFSRAPIPHNAAEYYHHIGIYAYKRKSLERFVNLKPSNLEKTESLEQLRALENQMTIAVQIVDSHPLSVDNSEDLEKVRNFLRNK
ncbi:MAG: 3-deoxy-manno-octulosonate cytidylyltransferase (CMP-KDO synthetase) [Rickettsiales bacterium]|jgi:3-deoxy-manno-octulosonate cytidylyltransferase (CMP-KDO synthetase)